MKILGIAASARGNGNSEILLDRFLKGAASKGARAEKVVLHKLNIAPCRSCSYCHKNGICIIKDDMSMLYRKLKSADAIVVASPVYFGSITAQLKIMIDRCQPIWAERFILKRKPRARQKRKGAFISVSGYNRREFFQNSKAIVKIFFMVLGIELLSELYVPSLERPGDVLKRKHALKKAFVLGAALIPRRN